MRSSIIDSRLKYLEKSLVSLREIDSDILAAGDPALKMEYEEEYELIFADLEDHAQDALFLLEAYFEDCKANNYPIVLEYRRVYKELDYARKFKLLHME